jgi:endonuclease/exonuclease/phosphatase family metal-dependent hydrolase
MKINYLVCLMMFFIVSAEAESFIYFQNNTSLNLNISTTSTLSNSYWIQNFSGNFEAWKLQTKIFGVNRDQGISNGSDYFLTTTVSTGLESIDLKIKLNGNFIGSDIWHSASSANFSHPWHSNNNFYSEEFVLNSDTFILTYRVDLPPGNVWSDFYYVLQEKHPYEMNLQELADSNALNILSYNVFMLTPPIGSSEEYIRAGILHHYVKNFDAIILSEAFYNSARNNLIIPLLSPEYPYHTSVVNGSSIEDGGVMIFSKWPIEYEQQFLYTDCDGTDCLSSKGVMYAKINKLGKKYHLFGTHTQAWPDATSISVRLDQLGELHDFIDIQNIPNTEAVLIGGDLNVNKANTNLSLEYSPMIDTLNVEEPAYLGLPFTYNIDYNSYASGPKEYLDFVFYEKDYLCAVEYTNTVKIYRHVEQIDALWDNNSLNLDVSDHYPVHGRFVFPSVNIFSQKDSLCFGEEMLLYANSNIDLAYQWYRNDTLLIGEQNDSLAGIATNGLYHCEATHGTCNPIITKEVNLFVYAKIDDPIILRDNNLIIANANTGIQWYYNNTLMPGEHDSLITTCEEGNYYCIYTLGYCSSDTSNSIDVISETPTIIVYNNIAVSSIANGNIWYNSSGEILNETNDTLILCEEDDYFVLNNYEICLSDTSNIISYQNVFTEPIITLNSDTLFSSENNGNQWYINGNLLPGEILNFLIPDSNGDYYCAIQNNCGILYSNEITVKTTSIEAVVQEDFLIYPNPVKEGEINFKFTTGMGNSVDFKLFSINGEVVMHERINNTNNLNIKLPFGLKGIYIAVLENKKGKRYIQKLKIIN